MQIGCDSSLSVQPHTMLWEHKGLEHHLFPSSSLFLSKVLFPTAVTHQIPSAPSDASISTVTSPATTEMTYTVVALASSIAATTYRNKNIKDEMEFQKNTWNKTISDDHELYRALCTASLPG